MPKPGEQPAPARKGTLTLSMLAVFDDLITDITVDRVYYWSEILKNRARYSACRGVKDEDVPTILRESIIEFKSLNRATDKVLQLSGVYRAYERMSAEEREHFKDHLKRYLEMYSCDCPWEVSTTNRYTIDTQEAAITARKPINQGETIKYLTGIQVPITREAEKDLDLTRKDFSIVKSSRKKTSSLFLGPARFANHDCNSNARLTIAPNSGMAVTARRDINIGDEITVTYGDQYFGENNCECLCATCEEKNINGWNPAYAPRDNSSSDDDDDDDDDEDRSRTSYGASRSQSRHDRHESATRSLSTRQSGTPEVGSTSSRKRVRTDDNEAGKGTMKRARAGDRLSAVKLANLKNKQSAASDAASLQPARVGPSSRRRGKINSSSPSSRDSSQYSTEATTLSDSLIQTMNGARRSSAAAARPSTENEQLSGGRRSTNTSAGPDLGGGATLIAHRPLDSETLGTKSPIGTPERGHAARSSSDKHDRSPHAKGREPKDYVLTKSLLSTPYSRWVQCKVCEEYFIQPEAHQTRWSCPRCERHSKLYGYQWPKTHKHGKHDTEERITDHRTIHPFIHPEEERAVVKGKSASLKLLQDSQVSGNNSPRYLSSEEADGNRPRRSASKRTIDYYQTAEDEWESDHGDTPRQTLSIPNQTNLRTGKRQYVRSGQFSREAKAQRRAEREEQRRASAQVRTVKPKRAEGPRLRPDGTPKRAYQKSGKYIGRARKRLEKRQMKAAGLLVARGGRNKLLGRARPSPSPSASPERPTSSDDPQSQKRRYIKSGLYSKKNKSKPAAKSKSSRASGRSDVRSKATTATTTSTKRKPQPAATTTSAPKRKVDADGYEIDEKGRRLESTKWKGWVYVVDDDADKEDDEPQILEGTTRSGRTRTRIPREETPPSRSSSPYTDINEGWEDIPDNSDLPSDYDSNLSDDEEIEVASNAGSVIDDSQGSDQSSTANRPGQAKQPFIIADDDDDNNEDTSEDDGRHGSDFASDENDDSGSGDDNSQNDDDNDDDDDDDDDVDDVVGPVTRRSARSRANAKQATPQRRSSRPAGTTPISREPSRRIKRRRSEHDDIDDQQPSPKRTRHSARNSLPAVTTKQPKADSGASRDAPTKPTRWKGWVYLVEDGEDGDGSSSNGTAQPKNGDAAPTNEGKNVRAYPKTRASSSREASGTPAVTIEESTAATRSSGPVNREALEKSDLKHELTPAIVEDKRQPMSSNKSAQPPTSFGDGENSSTSVSLPQGGALDESLNKAASPRLRRPSKWAKTLSVPDTANASVPEAAVPLPMPLPPPPTRSEPASRRQYVQQKLPVQFKQASVNHTVPPSRPIQPVANSTNWPNYHYVPAPTTVSTFWEYSPPNPDNLLPPVRMPPTRAMPRDLHGSSNDRPVVSDPHAHRPVQTASTTPSTTQGIQKRKVVPPHLL